MFLERILRSALLSWALNMFWVLAIGHSLYLHDRVGLIVGLLGLAATLLIIGAIKSRSRRGMYPQSSHTA